MPGVVVAAAGTSGGAEEREVKGMAVRTRRRSDKRNGSWSQRNGQGNRSRKKERRMVASYREISSRMEAVKRSDEGLQNT